MITTALLFHATTWGATESDLTDLLEQENRVFAASRYQQTLAQTPANVSILTREDIVRFGYRTLGEALSAVPGFYNAASQWPAQGLRGVAVPGDFGSRVLYMVNGMPIYEPTYGGFFSDYLDLSSIERIEVVRGSGSALYGSGAVMGIVNLITRSGQTSPQKNAELGVGSNNTYKAYGSVGNVSAAGTDSFVSVSTASSHGRDLYLREYDRLGFNGGMSNGNDAMQDMHLFGRVEKDGAWAQTVLIQLNKHDPLASYQTTFNSNLLLLRERFAAVETGLNRPLEDGALFTGRLYFFNVSEKGDYPSNLAGTQNPGSATFINVSDLASRQYGAEARYDQYMLDDHHVLTGLELKQVDANYQAGNQPGLVRSGVVSASGQPSYGQYSVFIQDEVALSLRGKLFAGLRYDRYRYIAEGVTGHVSPRLAYVYQFDPMHSGKLSYGEAYRIPTIYESQYTDGQPAAQSLWTNPGLKPEITRTLEALWESEPEKGLRWNIGPYWMRISNSPTQVVVPVLNGVACGGAQCVQYQNSNDTQQVLGIESSIKRTRDDGSSLYSSASLQRGYRLSDNATLPSSPHFLWKGGASYPLPWQELNGAVEANFVSRVQGRIDFNGARTAAAPAYLLVNLSINSRESHDSWHGSLRVNNLFNRTTYTIASRELAPLELVPGYRRTLWLTIGRAF